MSNASTPSARPRASTPVKQFSFLRIPVVLKRRGISRSGHYSEVKARLYTAPIRIGPRAVAYPDYEVDLQNAARVAGMSESEIRDLVVELEAARSSALPSWGPV